MWIFTPDSFISVVDKGDPSGNTLLVRARQKGDIERLFPGAEVQQGGGTDYAFRARIDREEVALRMADEVRGIRYVNFKDAVKEKPRQNALKRVWQAMFDFQESRR